jgi:hypothetical protein
MNQSKFTLSDVLTILTALVFGFICFLGTNFYTLGNMPKSIGLSVLITVLLFSTAFIPKLLKRTSINFKTCFIWEITFIVVFTLLFAFFTIMPFSHYFTVKNKDTEIVNKLQTSITQAENMFPAYESYAEDRKSLYHSKLKSVVASKKNNPTDYNEYGFKNGISDETQINKKMENINATLFPSNYSDVTTQKGLKEVATNWLLEAKNITESWKPIGITNVVVEINNKSNEWLSILVEISTNREKGEQAVDFPNSPLTFDDIKQNFTKVEKTTLTSLLFAMLMWFLMILSWLVTKRSTKSTIGIIKAKGEFDVEV